MSEPQQAQPPPDTPPTDLLLLLHRALNAITEFKPADAGPARLLGALPSHVLAEHLNFNIACDLCLTYRADPGLAALADDPAWAQLTGHKIQDGRHQALPEARLALIDDDRSPIGVGALLCLRTEPKHLSLDQFALLGRCMGLCQRGDGYRFGILGRDEWPVLVGLLKSGAAGFLRHDLRIMHELKDRLLHGVASGALSPLADPDHAITHPVVLYPHLAAPTFGWVVSLAYQADDVRWLKSQRGRWKPGAEAWHLLAANAGEVQALVRTLAARFGSRLCIALPDPDQAHPIASRVTYYAEADRATLDEALADSHAALVRWADQVRKTLVTPRKLADQAALAAVVVPDIQGRPVGRIYVPYEQVDLREQVKQVGARYNTRLKGHWDLPLNSYSETLLAGLPIQWERPLSDALSDYPVPPFGYLDLRRDGFILMNTPYNEGLVNFIRKRIPRIDKEWDPDNKLWSFRIATPELPARVLDLTRTYHLVLRDPQGVELSLEDSERYMDELATTLKNRLGESYEAASSYEVAGFVVEPFPYQRAGMHYVRKHGSTMIGDDCGLGKTPQAIGALVDHDAFPALVACPSIARLTWRDEIQKFIDCVPAAEVAVLGVGSTPKLKQEALVHAETAKVVIVNYDILFTHRELLSRLPFKGLVLDESHYLKNESAQRTQAAIQVAANPSIELKLLLSATPFVNHPSEMLIQLDILGKVDVLGGKEYILSMDNAPATERAEFNRRLRSVCLIRREKAQVWEDMPDVLVSNIPCALDASYKKAEREWVCKVLAQALEPLDAGVLADLKRQVTDNPAGLVENLGKLPLPSAGGSAPSVHFSEISALRKKLGDAKVPAMLDWLRLFRDANPVHEKLVIFANHISVQKALYEGAKRLGMEVVRLTGDQSPAARKDAERAFQEGTARVCVASMKAARENITLSAGSHVLFAELDYSGGVMIQCRDRLIRISQLAATVNVYFGLMSDSLDVSMAKSVREKMASITQSLGDEHAQSGLSAESAKGAITELLMRHESLACSIVEGFRKAA